VEPAELPKPPNHASEPPEPAELRTSTAELSCQLGWSGRPGELASAPKPLEPVQPADLDVELVEPSESSWPSRPS